MTEAAAHFVCLCVLRWGVIILYWELVIQERDSLR